MLHPTRRSTKLISDLKHPDGEGGAPGHHSFIDDVALNHGPRDLLGSIILHAYAECRRAGVTLSLEPIDCLVELNARNRDSWAPLLGVFDYRLGQVGRSNSYCIVGRNDRGEAVYTRAARLYEISASSNFAQLTEEMRHLYASPQAAPTPNESWRISGNASDAMKGIKGRVAFSGGVWCHPSFRKKGFTRLATHLGRAYSYGLWGSDYTVTFMAKGVVEGGHAKNTGYSNVTWTVHARNASIGDMDIAFMWVNASEALSQMQDELGGISPQIDRSVVNR